jgi:uncharacterized protein
MGNHPRRDPWRPEMKFKTCPASVSVKSMPGALAEGQPFEFEAIVSVFNNPDAGGDIVRPRAFIDNIEAWKSSGDTVPVYWSHRMDDPFYNVGGLADWDEVSPGDKRIPENAHPWVKDNGGLWVRGLLDREEHAAVARQVAYLMSKRRVTQFSFAYDVLAERPTPDGKYNELLKLAVYEVGPTPIGMNELTELGDVKSAEEEQPAPPQEQPPSEQDANTEERRPSPALLRLRCDLAAMQHEHTAD